MKYLNEESQFTRVSDAMANQIMETMGYDIPEAEIINTVSNIYQSDTERFILTEEVVEGDDDTLYVKLERIEGNTIINVDESGRENLIESVSYEDSEYDLNGVFEDEDGFLYAKLVNEDLDPGDDDEDDDEDEDEETEE